MSAANDYDKGFRAACLAACKVIEAECSGWNDEARRAFKKIDELQPAAEVESPTEANWVPCCARCSNAVLNAGDLCDACAPEPLIITGPVGNCDGSGKYAWGEDGRGSKLGTKCPGCRACR